MQSSFEQAHKNVLVYEGGKVDHPSDPGGRTNQGVTQKVFAAYLRGNNKPVRDVYTMTVQERDDIYRAQYWHRIQADRLPAGVDFVVYDGAVNSGVAQSAKWLQRALGLTADGVIGDVTIEAARNHPDHDMLVAAICERRLVFLRALKTWGTFGKGWSRRVTNVQLNGQAMASGSVGPAPVFTSEGAHKATIADAKKAPARAPADALASGGVVTTGLTTAQDALAPLSGHAWAATAVSVLIGVGAVATIAGLGYGWYARRKQTELDDALDQGVPATVVEAA